MQNIKFNTKGYDGFIDFIKAYCILVVVFCHGFPYLKEIGYEVWGVQIPLFLMIQVFHSYKREPKSVNWRMIGRRIILPFVLVETFIFLTKFAWGGQFLIQLLKTGIVGGGLGPGSYYPWVYLQLAILIPLMRPICEKFDKRKSLVLFILLSVVIEIVCSVINLPDTVYRLLCLRYVILIWFGWIWVKEGVKLNVKTITVSLISLCCIIYLGYFAVNNEPWLYNTSWTTHRWICYFWVSWLFVGILYWLYKALMRRGMIMKIVKMLASASYEIFLAQMAYYALVTIDKFTILENVYLRFLIWFTMAFVVSILGGIGLNRVEKAILK